MLHENKNSVKSIISILGSQAVVGSIDYLIEENEAFVVKLNGTKKTKKSLLDFVAYIEDMGVGEIFLQNINFDGKARGYDIETIEKVVEKASIPVIACSGAGKPDHFMEIAKIDKLSAIATGNYFNFKELSYPNVKKELKIVLMSDKKST